jgi:predicted transcriptional regulator
MVGAGPLRSRQQRQTENPIEEIAMFLCRSQREVREKIAELERSGELARRIEETAANAQPD